MGIPIDPESSFRNSCVVRSLAPVVGSIEPGDWCYTDYMNELVDEILDIPAIREAMAAKVELGALKLALLQQQTPPPNA